MKRKAQRKVQSKVQRKAQISHAFTYIMVIILIGLIVVFGYKGVMSILKTQCEHKSITFKQNLLTYLDDYSDKGLVHEETLSVPCGAKEICFVDYGYLDSSCSPPANLSELISDDVLYYSAFTDKTHNIFIKTKFIEAIALSDKIALKQDGSCPSFNNLYTCFKVKGDQIKFLFMGLGRKTFINST